MSPKVSVIIPAFNEESSIGLVLNDLPKDTLHEIIVVDNGSTDDTANVASESGARVVEEKQKGYGSACLRGIAELTQPDIVVFLDGDYSDYPEEITKLIQPILDGEKDFVLGSRMILPESAFSPVAAGTLRQLAGGLLDTDIFQTPLYRPWAISGDSA